MAAIAQASWYRSSWRGLLPGASTPGDSRLITPETTPPSIPTNPRTAPGGDPQDTLWLFTVNAQPYPDITVAAGQSELWRVVNLSPTVTYVVDLVGESGARQNLHL